MSKTTNHFIIRAAAVGLAAAGMMTGFTGCDKDKKNTEPSKESKESIVTTVDMPSKTEPVVITTEPATTEPVVTEPTEIVTTEPVVETTEAVDYIDLNNVKLIELSLDTGNYYYTMEIDSTKVFDDVPRKAIAYSVDDDDYYGAVMGIADGIYKCVTEKYVGLGLSEGCCGWKETYFDMSGNEAGIVLYYENPDESTHVDYSFSTKYGVESGEAYTGNQLLDYKSVSAAEVFGVDELPRKEFFAFLKTLKEINFDTIVDQWEAFQS